LKTGTIDAFIAINQTSRTIYQYLSDPRHLVGIQPNVTRIEQVIPLDGVHGYEYAAVEVLHALGMIPFDVRIRVRMLLTQPDREIQQSADATMGIRVHQRLTLEAIAPGITNVSNHIQVQAPELVYGYVYAQAQSAHQQFVVNLKERVENL
jgi:hypothetical protein